MKGKKDWLIIALLAMGAIIYLLIYRFFFFGAPVYAEIYEKNQRVKTIALRAGAETSFSLPGKENVIFQVFEDGSIAFIHSDCPDQICVRAGRLSMQGQSAACLPNDLIVKLVPAGKQGPEDLDVVIGERSGYGIKTKNR